MCCCGKPTINGERGYRWNQPNSAPSVYPVNPPTLGERDVLLFDEPGRCGGLDCHSHHFRLVKHCGIALLVRHGGGDERVRVSSTPTLLETLTSLDSNQRYWIFNAIYHAHSDARREATDREAAVWRSAAADKRIKTRKYPARGVVKVWIEPKEAA